MLLCSAVLQPKVEATPQSRNERTDVHLAGKTGEVKRNNVCDTKLGGGGAQKANPVDVALPYLETSVAMAMGREQEEASEVFAETPSCVQSVPHALTWSRCTSVKLICCLH